MHSGNRLPSGKLHAALRLLLYNSLLFLHLGHLKVGLDMPTGVGGQNWAL